MMGMRLRFEGPVQCLAAVVAVPAMLSACLAKNSSPDVTIDNGVAGFGMSSGNAGSSSDLRGVSGSGGSIAAADSGDAGAAGAGMADELPDAGHPPFQARLNGGYVTVRTLEDVWVRTCDDNAQVLQQHGNDWEPLRDERPAAFNLQHAAHFLDGAFHSDCRLSLGCDVSTCDVWTYSGNPSGGGYLSLPARELVRLGDVEAPSCDGIDAGVESDAGNAGLRVVPSLESRAPTGPLRVRVQWYRDGQCDHPLTADLAVE
jgi:hypothetical protein